jgi:hypothetical protein
LDFARAPQGSRAFYLARAWPQLAIATSLPPVGGHDRQRRSIVRQQGDRSQRHQDDDRSGRTEIRDETGRLAGDASYGSAAMLARLVEQKGIAPHVYFANARALFED